MKKKLRLLLFKACNRRCPGCCNQYWDLDNLEVCTSFKGYDEILLTGGEPMLKPDLVEIVIKMIRLENPKAKIYMYTAKIDTVHIHYILKLIDGLTLTLHNQKDVKPFMDLYLHHYPVRKRLSLRLNVFKEVKLPPYLELKDWNVKDNMVWEIGCPLPDGEVLMKLYTGRL